MLRLTATSQSEKEAVLVVDGWVSGQDVDVLEEEGTRLLEEAERLVLELAGVKFIDQPGLELLKRWTGRRLVLRDASPFVQALLEQHGLL